MPDELIVIAAHGSEYIQDCLNSLGSDKNILVVDTHSDEPIKLDGVKVIRTPFKGFTTGAYLWAYWHVKAKNYFFMQDSMVAKEPNFIQGFRDIMPEMGAVGWCYFGTGFDDDNQLAWCRYYYENEEPEQSIWGPVFYTNKKSLDELTKKQLLPPVPMNKNQAQGTERLWGWAFKKAGMEVKFLNGEWSSGNMQNGEFDTFIKKFAGRI